MDGEKLDVSYMTRPIDCNVNSGYLSLCMCQKFMQQTCPICSIKSLTTGRVPTPVDHTTNPCGTEQTSPFDFTLTLISLSETLTTRHPV